MAMDEVELDTREGNGFIGSRYSEGSDDSSDSDESDGFGDLDNFCNNIWQLGVE